jgi:hypothetical protein
VLIVIWIESDEVEQEVKPDLTGGEMPAGEMVVDVVGAALGTELGVTPCRCTTCCDGPRGRTRCLVSARVDVELVPLPQAARTIPVRSTRKPT